MQQTEFLINFKQTQNLENKLLFSEQFKRPMDSRNIYYCL